jgi:dynein regulatry complex protein 1
MVNNNADNEFNTNVPDREERKKIRRKRIEKRHATDDTNGNINADSTQGTHKSGLQQVSESLYHLDKRKSGGIQDVTQIRVSTDEEESRRRVNDEKMRHERLTKLQQEALSSAKANAAIEMKWAELLEKEIPQELHHDIQLQMASCQSIISSKDSLTGEFLLQLRSKDEEYVRALRQQSEDVESLLTHIRTEFKEMQTEYDKEIDAIEDAYLDERDRIIADHTTDIDQLFESRRNKEVMYKESKQKREEQYQKEIEELITKGADQYNKLKIELEMNIQTLKQQLEEIRATYQLNTEKLDYNYRVLTELDVEKNAELSRYKRRLTRLKDQLNHYASKFNQMNSSDSKINNDLTENYRRLTQKYKDLQAKFRHFEVADTQKFDEVWGMHEDEAKDLIDQLLKADKILTEQQLGWIWKAPDMLSLTMNKQGGDQSSGTKTEAGGSSNNTGAAPPAGGGADNSTLEGTTKTGPVVSGSRIRSVLKILSQEAGFLGLQPQVQRSIDEIPDDKTSDLGSAEAMLRALGIKSEEKVVLLMNYFFTDNVQGCMVEMEGDDGDAFPNSENEELDEFGEPLQPERVFGEDDLALNFPGEDIEELRLMISPESVMGAIKSFLDDTAVETDAVSAMGATKKDDLAGAGAKKKANGIQNYWTQLSQVVSDDSVGVWSQLETDIKNYKDILKKRKDTIAQVDDLTLQNDELKRVLNQYLGDQKNEMFCIPPSQTMRVNKVVNPATKGKTGKAPVLMSKTNPF